MSESAVRHVVLYTDAPARGGAEMALRRLAAALDPQLKVTVVGVQPDVVSWVVAARPSAGSLVLPAIRGKFDVAGVLRHRRAFRSLGADVVHANLVAPWSCQYAIAAALTIPGLRVVAVEHAFFTPGSRLTLVLKRWNARRLTAHVAVGEEAARSVEDMARLPGGSVEVIPAGVPDPLVPPRAGRWPAPVFGTIARLDPLKRLDLLVDALVALPGTQCVIAGEGPERGPLEARAADLGVSDRLHLVGWVEEPVTVLAELDVFVMCSEVESGPMTVVEAMLARRPVVATAVGLVPGLVVDGVDGRVVAPSDRPAVAQAIGELLADPSRAAAMGRAGRERVRQRFSVADTARAFEGRYRRPRPRRRW